VLLGAQWEVEAVDVDRTDELAFTAEVEDNALEVFAGGHCVPFVACGFDEMRPSLRLDAATASYPTSSAVRCRMRCEWVTGLWKE
jgi:hypothetical protein